jgi:SNF2 family DNA or RNA helicase
MNFQPHEYQMKGIKHLVSRPGAALFFDPGMGKTSTTLAAFSVLQDAGHAKGMLVVAPLRPTYRVWPTEVLKWADFNGLRVEILHGPKKADALRREADIYVINYEGLAWLEEQAKKLKTLPFDVLCLDESTKIKNTQTQRYKTLRRMRSHFNRFWMLTGTPAPNGLQDLFGQVFMLDGGQRLGKFVTHFRREFFIEYPQRGGYSLWEPRATARGEIEARLADVAMTLKAEDYLKMPRLMENVIEVELPSSAMKVYNRLENDYIAELNSGTVTAANAAAKGMKLRQIASGGVYGTEGAEGVHTAKLDALVDLIEEQEGQPLLVAVAFQHEVDAIRKALGVDVPYLGGGVSITQSNAIVDEWNAGKHPVLLAHPTSVAHGLNLQAGGNAVCWFSLTWNLEEFEQFNRRVYRQGQTKPVVLHYIMAVDTIDADVLEKLRAKEKVQTALMNSLKAKHKDDNDD